MRWVLGGYHMIEFVPSAADILYVLGMQCDPYVQLHRRAFASVYLSVWTFVCGRPVSEAASTYLCDHLSRSVKILAGLRCGYG